MGSVASTQTYVVQVYPQIEVEAGRELRSPGRGLLESSEYFGVTES